MPNSTKVLSSFVDLAVESQLIAELVHKVNATESSANDKDLCLEVVGVDICVTTLIGLIQIDILAKRHVVVFWQYVQIKKLLNRYNNVTGREEETRNAGIS